MYTPAADNLAQQLDEAEFGPNIDFREYSFLNNTMVRGPGSSMCSRGTGVWLGCVCVSAPACDDTPVPFAHC